jgi:tRNA-2-methylthio-N6-dimethylallyladenosine synthase
MIDAPLAAPSDACEPATRRVHVITYGCQMNVYDSRRIAQVLGDDGWQETGDPALADLVLINTCSVRERPEQKVLGTLSRLMPLKESHPGLRFGVCGCVAQQHGEALLKRVPYLDLVFGPDRIGDLPEMLRAVADGDRQARTTLDAPADHAFLPVDPAAESGPAAFLTIMKGCDRFCSYCIVPHVRGREVSKPADRVVAEVASLVAGGVREVTLLGQNVNAWGKEAGGGARFPDLLRQVSAVPGLARLRFVTSHPADADDAMLDLFGALPNLAEYLHLPVQSGSDAVLSRMRRGYAVDRYLDRLRRVRQACPDVSVSTDFIVGFPGETDEDFAATMRLVEEAGFDLIFSFKYSPRPGTAAALLADDVPESVKVDRLARLQALQDGITARRMQRYRGRVEEVLVEGPSRDMVRGGRGQGAVLEVAGRTRTNVVVNVPVDVPADRLRGRLARVRIDEVLPHSLRGTALSWEEP